VSRLDEHDEDEVNWGQTIRPIAGLDPTSSRLQSHSRDSSIEKVSQPPSAVTSPRLHALHTRAGLGGVVERVVDPKSATYGHHRQTSIVHGYQHSRNGSLASTSSSPLSPRIIAAAGAGMDRPDMQSVAARLEADSSHGSRPPTALSGSLSNASTPALERTSSAADIPSHGATQRKVERMQSRSRRDHAHNHSHSSRHQRDEQKTVGEYALHVLFTSVSTVVLICIFLSILTMLRSLSLKPRRN
jgi:hypothetical protein